MNIVSLLLTLHVALAMGLARPSVDAAPAEKSRGRRSRADRKMRILQRALRELTHNEVLALLRTKKNKSRNPPYDSYFTVPSRPEVTLPQIGEYIYLYRMQFANVLKSAESGEFDRKRNLSKVIRVGNGKTVFVNNESFL